MQEINNETYQAIRDTAFLPFSIADVEDLCELEHGTIRQGSKVYEAYLRGQLEARQAIYRALMTDITENANVQAAKEMAKQFEALQKEKDSSQFNGLAE